MTPRVRHSYSLYIINQRGEREPILEHDESPIKVRNVAQKIRQRPGRKIVIERDNKELPGGASGLDREAYDRWLESHQNLEVE